MAVTPISIELVKLQTDREAGRFAARPCPPCVLVLFQT